MLIHEIAHGGCTGSVGVCVGGGGGIFAFAFSMADRECEPIRDDRAVSEKACYPGTSCVWSECKQYLNQQMSGESGRECTTEYGGAEHSSFLPVLLNVLGCRLTY